MKNLVLILAVLMAVSCTATRSVHKTSVSIDSAAVKKEQAFSKSDEALSIETKKVSIVSDTARSKADSAKTAFSYNPADTSNDEIEAEVETGTLKAKMKLNKKTGKGSLEAYKKPEDIPVNRYQEENTKLKYNSSDSSGRSFLDSINLKSLATGKVTDSKKDYTWLWITAGLVILVLLVAGYFWLRNQYVNPKRILP